MDSGGSERRKAKRFTYVCEVECGNSDRFSLNRLANLSAAGAWVEALNPSPEGSLVTLTFDIGMQQVRARARVIRRVEGHGMGVLFEDLSPRYREAIEALTSFGRKIIR